MVSRTPRKPAQKPAANEPWWVISRIKATPAVELGRVRAPDYASAIARYIEEHKVTDPHRQQRLAARRVG
jgi:hypothetical protein